MKNKLLENITFYFSGFLIVSIFLIISFFYSYANIEKSVYGEVENNLKNGIVRLEDLFGKLQMVNNVILQDTNFNTIIYQNKNSTSSVIAMKNLNGLYRNLVIISDDISYAFTLFSNCSFFLSSSDISFDFGDYYSNFMSISYEGKEIQTSEEARNIITEAFSKGIQCLRLDSISFIASNGMTRIQEPLLILHSSSNFAASPLFITAYVIEKETIVKTLLQDDYADIAKLRIKDMETGAVLLDTLSYNENGNDFVFQAKSRLFNYSIDLAIPSSYFMQELTSMLWLLFGIIIAGIITGVLFAIFYGLRQYISFNRIYSTFEDESKQTIAKGDFADLQKKIIDLKKKGESYKTIAEEQERQNKAIYFQNIITQGIKSEEDKLFISKQLDFLAEGTGYIVAVFSVIRKHTDDIATKFYEMLNERNFCRSLGIHSGSNDEIFIIPASEQSIISLNEAIQSFLSRQQVDVVHIGLSPLSFEAEELPAMYENAKRAVVSLYMYEGENRLITYEEENRATLFEFFNLESLTRLKNLLLRGQEKEVESMLEEMFNKIEAFPLEAETRKEEIYYSLISVYKDAYQNLNSIEMQFDKYQPSIRFSQLKELFINATAGLCQHMQKMKKSHNQELLANILSYIDENYSNPGLSPYDISKKADINEKYLQSFFKEQMGTTLSQYLLAKRLMKAKTLLEETDYSNEKISIMTGFGAVNTFYRNFSKYFGLTPKAYKEGLGKKNDSKL